MSTMSERVFSSGTPPPPAFFQFTPQFLKSFSFYLEESARRRGEGQPQTGGLLFGTAEAHLVRVEAFKASWPGESNRTQSGEEEGFETALRESLASWKSDAKFSSFELVGWYSMRPGAPITLLESDIEIHNRHFHSPAHLLMIMKPEQDGHVLAELFTSYAGMRLSTEDHTYGSLNWSTRSSVSSAINVAVRANFNNEFYLNVYKVCASIERVQGREESRTKPSSKKNNPISLVRLRANSARAEEHRSAAIPHAAVSAEQPAPPELQNVPETKTSEAGSAKEPLNQAQASTPPMVPSSSEISTPLHDETVPALAKRPVLADAEDATTPSSLPAPRTHASVKRSGAIWTLIVIGVMLASGTFVAWFYLRAQSSPNAAAVQRSIEPDSPSALGLEVASEGDHLRVSWDGHAVAFQSAERAVLEVEDASQAREFPLNSREIAKAFFVYRPTSDDVTFHLRVRDKSGSTTTEVARMLGASDAPRSPRLPAELRAKNSKPSDSSMKTPAAAQVAAPGSVPIKRAALPVSTNRESEVNYVAPLPLRKVMPDPLPSVVNSPTEISVQVKIDETGHVLDASALKNGSTDNQILAKLAVDAAKQWVFQPAKVRDKNVPSALTIVFQFRVRG
jgi:Gram-negative bacterial TonB protein C-terminal